MLTSQRIEVDLGQACSPFETELLATVQEQGDLLKEYKDHEDSRVSEGVTILNDTMQNLCDEFACVGNHNRLLQRTDGLCVEGRLEGKTMHIVDTGTNISIVAPTVAEHWERLVVCTTSSELLKICNRGKVRSVGGSYA